VILEKFKMVTGLVRKLGTEFWDFLGGEKTNKKIKEFRADNFSGFEGANIKSGGKWYSFGNFLDSLDSFYNFWMPVQGAASIGLAMGATVDYFSDTNHLLGYSVVALAKGLIYAKGLITRKKIESARGYIDANKVRDFDLDFLEDFDVDCRRILSRQDSWKDQIDMFFGGLNKKNYSNWKRNRDPRC